MALLLAAVSAAGVVIWKGQRSERELPERPLPLPTSSAPTSVPLTLTSAPLSVSAVVTAPSAPPSASVPVIKVRAVSKVPPASSASGSSRSRAAADGLTERNPFAN